MARWVRVVLSSEHACILVIPCEVQNACVLLSVNLEVPYTNLSDIDLCSTGAMEDFRQYFKQ